MGLLGTPFTVTTTVPVVAPEGIGATIEVAVQFVGTAAVPLNVTVLVPCVVPKFVPVMVTAVPDAPEFGDKLPIVGEGKTVNGAPVLVRPSTVTTTFPVVAPAGTGVVMVEVLQPVGMATVPLNVTVLFPCKDPKLEPVMVTNAPVAPEVGDKPAIDGVVRTVNDVPALLTPSTVKTMLPEVAPTGTATTIDVLLQFVGVADVPLNEMVLLPWVAPKFVPVMVSTAPISPDGADRLLMLGAGCTVKFMPVLGLSPAVTTTGPLLAPTGTGKTIDAELQLVVGAATPPMVTEPLPRLAPKFVPVIVTDVPTGPEAGVRLAILGGTVNATALLELPPTVTMTDPLLAPVGTGTTMDVMLQLVGVADTPPNVIELLPWVTPKFNPLTVIDVPAIPELGERVTMFG
jgi:hypothetical protein